MQLYVVAPCLFLASFSLEERLPNVDRVPTSKHADVLWNEETQEWFCAQCGRTSDHVTKEDALVELEQYECELPTTT